METSRSTRPTSSPISRTRPVAPSGSTTTCILRLRLPGFTSKVLLRKLPPRLDSSGSTTTVTKTLPHYETLVRETDRLDSVDLTLDDILDPQGFIKLGFTLDSRSGLGPLDRYFETVLDLLLKRTPVEEVLQHPAVDARCRRLETDDVELHKALQIHSQVDGNVVFSDFRGVDPVPAGNRFLVFALFPKINVAVRAQKRLDGPTMLTIGHSVINRTCKTNVGELAARYGGGGHQGAASIPLMEDTDQQIEMILAELKSAG